MSNSTQNKPSVYFSAQWGSMFTDGTLQSKFEKLRQAGYNVYNWASGDHTALSKAGQLSAINKALDPSHCIAYIWDVTDYERTDGTSKMQWHFALARGITVIIIDGKLDQREVHKSTGVKSHPATQYLADQTIVQEIDGMRTIQVKTFEEMMAILPTLHA